MYNYFVSACRSTAVTHCLTARFTSPDELNLIVCHGNRIEIFLCTDSGLQPLVDVPIYGRIAALETVTLNGKCCVFILTERYMFSIVSYDRQKGEIATEAMGCVEDAIGQRVECGIRGLVDPYARMFGLLLYDGLLKVIPVSSQDGGVGEAFNIRVEEQDVLDIVFLDTPQEPTLAVLYQDRKQERHCKCYTVNVKDKVLDECSEFPGRDQLERGADRLIPVPKARGGGVMVVGEQTITHLFPRTVRSAKETYRTVEFSTTIFTAYTRIDTDGYRHLLSDCNGQLHCLYLEPSAAEVTDQLKISVLGETSIASCLTYLDNGVVYIGSSFGDSQLIRLNTSAAGAKEGAASVELLDQYTNLGPITDFVVVDTEGQGQGKVITCSGAFKDGSLRVLRNGIGIQEQAVMELPGIRGMWSLKPSLLAHYERFLCLSFIGQTRFLLMDSEDSLEESDMEAVSGSRGFVTDQQTLHCGNMLGNMAVQITAGAVRLIDMTSFSLLDEWKCPSGAITLADSNASQVVVATSSTVFVLSTSESSQKWNLDGQQEMPHEIACVCIRPVAAKEKTSADLVAVGLWTDLTIRLLSTHSSGLDQLHSEQLPGDVVPRSILLHDFEGEYPYCLVAMNDGSLFSYHVSVERNGANSVQSVEMKKRKKVQLAKTPLVLSTFTVTGNSGAEDDVDMDDQQKDAGTEYVFAAGDRSTVLYTQGGKLLFSNVNLPECVHVCPFYYSIQCPDTLAIATQDSLLIGTVDAIQKLHITTVPLGESARRLAYHKATKTLIVATMKTFVDQTTMEERAVNMLRLYDSQTFEELDRVQLQDYEEVSKLLCTTLAGYPDEVVVAGSGYAVPEEDEPIAGRVMVYGVDTSRVDMPPRLQKLASKDVAGAVYGMAPFEGDRLVVSINGKVQVWTTSADRERNAAVDESAEASAADGGSGNVSLVKECGVQLHTLALVVDTHGEFILVGDIMKSLSLLQYKSVEERLVEVARDYDTKWITAISILNSEDSFLAAENTYNMFSLRRNTEAADDDDRRRLVNVGGVHLGDQVNRICPGSLVMRVNDTTSAPGTGTEGTTDAHASAAVDGSQVSTVLEVPDTFLYATVSGCIGVIARLKANEYAILEELQKAIHTVIKGVGGLKHEDWRTPMSYRRRMQSRSFIDGDLIEQFLDLKPEQQTRVVNTINEARKSGSDGGEKENKGLGSQSSAVATITVEDLVQKVEELSRLH